MCVCVCVRRARARMHRDILVLVYLNRLSKTEDTCQFAESTNYFVFARVARAFYIRVQIVYNDPRSLKFTTLFVCALLVCQMNDQRTLCTTLSLSLCLQSIKNF